MAALAESWEHNKRAGLQSQGYGLLMPVRGRSWTGNGIRDMGDPRRK
jgi:hypothetical protein